MSQAVVERALRQYAYCAKCGQLTDLEPGNYVCETCHRTPGWFEYCAMCGQSWLTLLTERDLSEALAELDKDGFRQLSYEEQAARLFVR
jgi:hypothetical protein